MNYQILIIGPLHPSAIGGIATIVRTLKKEFSDEDGVLFVDTNKPSSFLKRIIRPINLLFKIFGACLKVRGGVALMFSSAYASFWEKCIWCVICKISGVFTVVQMVDGNFPVFYERLPRAMRWFASMLIKNIDILAAQSDQWRIFYEKIFPHATVKIVSPGIDTDFFIPSQISKMNDPVKLIYIGWLIEAKGIYDLLNAVHIIKQKGLSLKLKLIGPDFGNKKIIYDVARHLDIENMIDISEPITSREMILKAYQSADIFVFPSHFEGFPYALMEAISCGLPCIGTRVGGIPDILENGYCGLLIDEKSPVQLAESICTLLENEAYRDTLGMRARVRAVSEYSLIKSFNDFRTVLNYNRKG